MTARQYAEVLAAHQRVPGERGMSCTCREWQGWSSNVDVRTTNREAHRLHLADALAAVLPDPEQAETYDVTMIGPAIPDLTVEERIAHEREQAVREAQLVAWNEGVSVGLRTPPHLGYTLVDANPYRAEARP